MLGFAAASAAVRAAAHAAAPAPPSQLKSSVAPPLPWYGRPRLPVVGLFFLWFLLIIVNVL